jgi:hypothetical protein
MNWPAGSYGIVGEDQLPGLCRPSLMIFDEIFEVPELSAGVQPQVQWRPKEFDEIGQAPVVLVQVGVPEWMPWSLMLLLADEIVRVLPEAVVAGV